MNEKQTNHAGTVSKLLSFANDCRGKLIGSMLLAILGVLCGMVLCCNADGGFLL